MASPQQFTNWRFNPFTNIKNPVNLTEQHTVKYFPEPNLYGIQAMEGIVLDNPSSVSLVYQNNGQRLEEVPKTQPPSRGQFRVDYDADTYFNTSLIELNSADNGIRITLSYKGTGSIVKSEYIFNQLTSIPTSLDVSGQLKARNINIVDSLAPVGTVVGYMPGHFSGGNGSTFYMHSGSNSINTAKRSLPPNWKLCDGSSPNDPQSPVFNSSNKHVPYLLGNRFLRGSNYAGGTGGSYTITIPGHYHSRGTLSVNYVGSHNHSYYDSHFRQGIGVKGDGSWFDGRYIGGTNRTTASGGSHTHSLSGSVGNTSASWNGDRDRSMNVWPPYMTCFYIIRIK